MNTIKDFTVLLCGILFYSFIILGNMSQFVKWLFSLINYHLPKCISLSDSTKSGQFLGGSNL